VRKVLGVVVVALLLPFLHSSADAQSRTRTCFGERATIVGTTGSDVIRGTSKRDVIAARSGEDVIRGRGGGDLICGGTDSDELYGGGGHDRLGGGPDGDRLYGGGGDDSIIGGEWFDEVHYFQSPRAVQVDLTTGSAEGHGSDELESIEGVYGSLFDDTLRGDASLSFPNVLFGNSGDDFIDGLLGGDIIFGWDGIDDLRGGEGQDIITPGLGDDLVDGGVGIDGAWFAQSPSAVTVSLVTGSSSGEGTDSLVGIENLQGSGFADVLEGDDFFNEIIGGDGNDRIIGLGADDLLKGFNGNDVMDGGVGNDQVEGFEGDDQLDGGPGSDVLRGGDGTDTCVNGEDVSGCESAPARMWRLGLEAIVPTASWADRPAGQATSALRERGRCCKRPLPLGGLSGASWVTSRR
jgi:Ca2+-binding RTX toxin-like protein